MATKNLVPRQDAEGKLGLSTRRWLEVNAVSGSFPTVFTNELKNSGNQNLIVAGDGISISYEDDLITITSSASGDSEVDRIFEGPEGTQTSVETINTNDPVENKISFSISGSEKWFINSDGHMLPKLSGNYDLGGSNNAVRRIWVNNDGLTFKTSGFLSSRINVTSKQRLQFGALSSTEGTTYDYVSISKENVRVATTSTSTSLLSELVQSNADTNILEYTSQTGPNTAITIDGVVLGDDDKVLIKDFTGSDMKKNGIYTISGIGTAVKLTRIGSLNNADDFANLNVTVLEGTENGQQIFFTVPYVDPQTSLSGTTVGIHDMKWLRVTGGGGLEAVFDDKAPVLGGDLKVGSFDIISENTDSIDLISSKGSTNGYEAGLTLYSGLGVPNITFKSTTTQPPQLLLETPDKKKIRIAGVSNLFFTSQSIVGQNFEYAFKDNLTTDEINASRAYFATQGWVESQGYVTTSPDLSNYIIDSTDSNPSLGSITILNEAENQQSWGTSNVVTKGYVDSLLQGIDEVLEPVKAATNQNVDLTNGLANGSTINGGTITLATGDRILVKNQTTASENGVYIVQATGAAVRSTDLAANSNANAVFVFVEEGSNASTGFLCTSPSGSDVVGTNNLTFVKMSSATEITVSGTSALTKTGNALSVNVDDSSIKINTDNKLSIKAIPSDAISLTSFSDLDTIADEDRFIITDASSTPDAHVAKRGTATLIKNYIRTDITSATGDVHFSLPTGNATVMSVEAQNTLITGKDELTTLANDDELLITDSANSGVLKSVKYSTIKSSIEAALDTELDIHGLPKIPDNNIGNLDELALYNMPADEDVTTVLESVRVFTASDTRPFNSGEEIDGVTLAVGDRVLLGRVANNANAVPNGIYVVTASGTSPRSSDLASGTAFDGFYVKVLEGNQNAGKDFILKGNPGNNTRIIDTDIVNVNEYTTQVNANRKISLAQLTSHVKKSLSKPVILTSPGTINPPVTNTHYILQYNQITGGGAYQFIFDFSSGTYEENDEVKISSAMLSSSPIYSVVIKTDSNDANNIIYTPEELQKTITLIYKSGAWKLNHKDHRTIPLKNSTSGSNGVTTSDTSRDFLVETDSSSSRSQWLANPVIILRDKDPLVVLPTSQTINALFPTGFTKTYYVANQSSAFVNFVSDIIISKGTSTTGFDFASNSKKITINPNEKNIAKITVTLLESENGPRGLFIESSEIFSESSGVDLPVSANGVLNYTDSENPTLQSTKIFGRNIASNQISGGEFTTPQGGGNETTTGNIKKNTIVGGTNGNIALNTVTPENIKKINDYKVYGQLSGESIPEEAKNISEVEIIHTGYEIPEADRPDDYQVTLGLENEIKKNNSLVTAKEIKNYVTNSIINNNRTLPAPESVPQLKTINFTEETVPGQLFTIEDDDFIGVETNVLVNSNVIPLCCKSFIAARKRSNQLSPYSNPLTLFDGETFSWTQASHPSGRTSIYYDDVYTKYSQMQEDQVDIDHTAGFKSLYGIELPSLAPGSLLHTALTQGKTPVIHLYLRSTADINDSARIAGGWQHRIAPPTFFVNRQDTVEPAFNNVLRRSINITNPSSTMPASNQNTSLYTPNTRTAVNYYLKNLGFNSGDLITNPARIFYPTDSQGRILPSVGGEFNNGRYISSDITYQSTEATGFSGGYIRGLKNTVGILDHFVKGVGGIPVQGTNRDVPGYKRFASGPGYEYAIHQNVGEYFTSGQESQITRTQYRLPFTSQLVSYGTSLLKYTTQCTYFRIIAYDFGDYNEIYSGGRYAWTVGSEGIIDQTIPVQG